MNDWRERHNEAITGFVADINECGSTFVLKGGTALYLCYGLDRFSEDVDLDGVDRNLIVEIDRFCAKRGYSYRIAKNTQTVQRCFVNYGNAERPLKIEASYRRAAIADNETTLIKGIRVYNIDTLCVLKTAAYAGRDKLRDLFDVAFICNNHFDKLSEQTRLFMRSSIEHKGIEQFDYIARTQSDELIDIHRLGEDFLRMYDKLGLLYYDNETGEIKI